MLVSGYCSRCGAEIGGFLRPPLWQCPTCRRIWCERCPKDRIGIMFRKYVCPECHIEMQEGGISSVKRSLQT